MSREILQATENLSMRFGGLLAVNGVALTVNEKQVVCDDRAQRRRQDHRIQLPDRFLPAIWRHHPARRRAEIQGLAGPPDRPQRRGAHFPERAVCSRT
jgi:hypothetical protein